MHPSDVVLSHTLILPQYSKLINSLQKYYDTILGITKRKKPIKKHPLLNIVLATENAAEKAADPPAAGLVFDRPGATLLNRTLSRRSSAIAIVDGNTLLPNNTTTTTDSTVSATASATASASAATTTASSPLVSLSVAGKQPSSTRRFVIDIPLPVELDTTGPDFSEYVNAVVEFRKWVFKHIEALLNTAIQRQYELRQAERQKRRALRSGTMDEGGVVGNATVENNNAATSSPRPRSAKFAEGDANAGIGFITREEKQAADLSETPTANDNHGLLPTSPLIVLAEPVSMNVQISDHAVTNESSPSPPKTNTGRPGDATEKEKNSVLPPRSGQFTPELVQSVGVRREQQLGGRSNAVGSTNHQAHSEGTSTVVKHAQTVRLGNRGAVGISSTIQQHSSASAVPPLRSKQYTDHGTIHNDHSKNNIRAHKLGHEHAADVVAAPTNVGLPSGGNPARGSVITDTLLGAMVPLQRERSIESVSDITHTDIGGGGAGTKPAGSGGGSSSDADDTTDDGDGSDREGDGGGSSNKSVSSESSSLPSVPVVGFCVAVFSVSLSSEIL